MISTRRGRRHSVNEVVYCPAAGVRSDFEKLFTTFTETKSVRYEQFVKIWRDMRMSLIFAGRQTEYECREFTEEMFRIAVEYWLPPYNFQVRVGALYLLYGLYYKQPYEIKVHIRLTREQWAETELFIQEVTKQQHLDVSYVYHKMLYEHAFQLVYNTVEVHPGSSNSRSTALREDKEEEVAQQEQLKDQKSLLSEVTETDIIDQLSTIHERYHQLKCDLAGDSATTPDGSLNFIQTDLVQHITKKAAAFEEWRSQVLAGKRPFRRRRDSGGSGRTTSESDADSDSDYKASPKKSRGGSSTIARIKEKAFAAAPSVSKSRRHRRAMHESDLDSDLKSPLSDAMSGSESKECKSSSSKKRKKEDMLHMLDFTSGEDEKEVEKKKTKKQGRGKAGGTTKGSKTKGGKAAEEKSEETKVKGKRGRKKASEDKDEGELSGKGKKGRKKAATAKKGPSPSPSEITQNSPVEVATPSPEKARKNGKRKSKGSKTSASRKKTKIEDKDAVAPIEEEGAAEVETEGKTPIHIATQAVVHMPPGVESEIQTETDQPADDGNPSLMEVDDAFEANPVVLDPSTTIAVSNSP